MKKRILQFIGSFHQGGSERQAVNLTRLLKGDGRYDISAATLNAEGVLRPEMDALGLGDIPEFPLTSFYDRNFISQVRRCAAYLREQHIELVHTHDFYTNVFGMAAATFASIPARIASKRETAGLRTAGQEFIEKIAFGRAHAIVANSLAVREHLIERGLGKDKISVIHNGIDTDRFAGLNINYIDTRQKLGLPADENIRLITMVANLRHPVKNVPMLLRAAALVIQLRTDVHFVVAGEGELQDEFRRQAADLGIAGKVHFIGRCTDVPALLAASYACVLTSVAEGFSNSILEYMASGRPVVATNVGGAAEAVIDGESGFVIPSDDDEAMSKILMLLLEKETFAAEMGRNGRQKVEENFSAEVQLSKTIDLYKQCLSD